MRQLAAWEHAVERSFGEALRQARRAASLSQQELADRAGLTVNGISQLERGVRTRPYPHTVRALADALGLDGPARERLLATAPARPPARAATVGGRLAPPPVLVGRHDDLARALLALERHRLVTLTGTGGVGKTSLALAVAEHVAATGSLTVTVVPLADVDDTEVALLTVAGCAGVHDGRDDVRERLRTTFTDGSRLLVLDNLEQLPGLTVEVAALLADLPQLRVLATSRGPLRSRLERELPVRPLALGDAVDLLVERATSAPAPLDADHLDGPTVQALRTICARVDGLPLAIELAGAWLRTLTPTELADRLEHALPLLVDGPMDLPERHRALRATIAWSERLLDDDHRRVFRTLSTFPAAWDLATAAAVADRPEVETLRAIALLVERSLVVREGDDLGGPARYRMLETVRAYGREQLASDADMDGPQERLAETVLDLVEQVGLGSHGAEQASWLTQVEERFPDVRSTLRWALTSGRDELAAKVYEPLIWTWYLRHPTEGVRWGREVLAGADELDDVLRARVEATWALAVYAGGDGHEALVAAQRAADRAAAASDAEGSARALAVLANAAASLEDRAVVEDAVRRTGDLEDDVPFAGIARASVRLAAVRLELAGGAVDAAQDLLALADEEVERAGAPWLRALWLNIAVGADLLAGRDGDNVARLERSLELSADLADVPATLYSIVLLAVDAALRGAANDAARLLGAAEGHATRTGQRIIDPGTDRLVVTLRRDLEARLGREGFVERLADGDRLGVHDVLAVARSATSGSA
jgi:predicted ATPase/DNA-binding XRE family transcriptional regulator